MNYLAHLYLADDTAESLVGSLLGDFVKGDDYNGYSEGVRRAILIHRKIDTFTDAHPLHKQSKARLNRKFRHTRGILVDLFYDHFLARNWAEYAGEPLPEFTRRVYYVLDKHVELMPPRLQRMLPAMITDNWLLSYRDLTNIGHALRGLSHRLGCDNELAQGLEELRRNYSSLENDFRAFFPELVDYVASLKGIIR
ncbi:MAG: ACP phosphodiesterase [Candidatus Neomarinimicrobiota bacterium]